MRSVAVYFLLLFGGAESIRAASPWSPENELSSFQLADANLAVELVAAEPAVTSPVSLAWDADGRLFVAEMNDYPVGPTAGRIRLLEDRDGDGRYEKSTVFADKLNFPNSVLPWRGGLLLTAAPDLIFLEDTDGDGRADKRRVLFTGFGEGNQQLRANGLTWGLDNWIYGANGRSDGEVRRAAGSNAKPVSLRGHDFRFRPDSLEFEPVAGRSQFGAARDDWGNRFLSWNTIPVRHEVLPERSLARNPLLAETESLQDLLAPGDTGRVFPLAPPPPTFNNESTSHFNALAGLAIYRGDALGETYRGNAFVGESLRNLVHRRVLEPDGVTFVAKRGEAGREFLASTDPWFHPVNFATGPDGALYIADFYRQWVEHPGFVHSKARDEIDWRRGAEHGRIWRVIRKPGGAPRMAVRPKLGKASPADLVTHLENPNGWWRDTAQRMLVERQDRSAVLPLVKLIRESSRAEARVAALFTLEGLNALEDALLRVSLRDGNPRVREAALRLAEPRLRRSSELRQAVLSLAFANEPDARVRLQQVLCLGAVEAPANLVALARLAPGVVSNRWMSTAILSGVGSNAWNFLQQVIANDSHDGADPGADQVTFYGRTAGLIGAAGREDETMAFLSFVSTPNGVAETTRLALLASYGDGVSRSRRSLRAILKQPPMAGSKAASGIRELFDVAARTATNLSAGAAQRQVAVRVLANAEPQQAGQTLIEVLRSGGSEALQSAAARSLVAAADPESAGTVFAGWEKFAPRARRHILGAALNSQTMIRALVTALEQNIVPAIELDAPAREALRKSAGPELRSRLEQLIRSAPAVDRAEVVSRFQPALSLPGDGDRGMALFDRLCSQCHGREDRGQRVGPDLAGVSSRPANLLLADILDPSRDVSPDFIAYELGTNDGERRLGIVVSETTAGVTLRRPNVPDEVIARSRIQELRASGKSLMPDGLEQGLSLQDVADLIACLRRPPAALSPAR